MMKIRKTTLFLFFLGLKMPVFGQTTPKTMLKLPDTGQTSSFTNTFGEDSDCTINPPFYIKNNNGTVTDTVTGLMWQQSDGGEMTYENAINYADTLVLGGFSDWRLPSPHEAFSILNHQRPNPALDIANFTSTGAEYWWTNARQSNDASKIWCTNAGGGIGNHLKTETISAGGTKKFHVRVVRNINTPINLTNQFTDNGDGTIKDNITNLIWQKTPLVDTLTWEQALVYAENLTLGGFSDWRLPNIKELQSLSDERILTPSVSTIFFPTIGIKKYWSSTSLPNQTTKAWYLSTQYGITTYDLKTVRLALICVRSNNNTNTATKETINNNDFVKINTYTIINNFLELEYVGNKQDFSAQIIDLEGRIIWQNHFKTNEYAAKINILLPNIHTGYYILNINNKEKSLSKKIFIIQ